MIPSSTVAARSAGRRQARFVASRVILSTDVRPEAWYDVCTGRRRGDTRPGMVLLDLGTRREHVPADCLEFRPAPERRLAGRLRPPLRRVRGRALSGVLPLLPLGAAALVAAYRLGAGSRG